MKSHLIRTLSLAVALSALAAIASGCCFCGDDDGPTCKTTLKYKGGEYSAKNPFIAKGTSSTKENAIQYACKDYCYTVDEAFDKKYKKWLEKDDNADHKERYGDDHRKGKKWIPVTSSFRREFDLCVDQCADKASRNKGDFKTTTTCEAPKGD